MARIIVRYSESSKLVPIINELLWYDTEHKELKKFSGTKLEYEYKLDESLNPPKHRLLPKAVEENKITKSINKEEVLKWYNNFINYNNTSIEIVGEENNSLIINSTDEEIDDVTYDLDRNGFKFDVL